MRVLSLLSLMCVAAFGESHPSYWNYTPPEATALAGIRWENVRRSVFAEAVAAELFGDNISFPDLPCLREARQMLLASPGPFAVLSGAFPLSCLRKQAAARGMNKWGHKGVEIWLAPEGTLSLAIINEQTLLLGQDDDLDAAIDRSLAEGAGELNPLLARAASLAAGSDLWVLASPFPDPLAGVFLPLDAEADTVGGRVSFRDGVELECVFETDSARELAASIRAAVPGLPQIARAMNITADDNHVRLLLTVTRQQLAANMRRPPEAAPEPPKPAQESPGHPHPRPR